MAGVGTNDTRHSVELAQQVKEIGADGVLLVTPYYSKPAAAGIFAHFERIASVSDAPVMLYDVPAALACGSHSRSINGRASCPM
ncbi:MAG: dihydrodipicolinate synthase family protein [Marmoricola sp.]